MAEQSSNTWNEGGGTEGATGGDAARRSRRSAS